MDSNRGFSDDHNPNELTDQNNPTRVCWCKGATNLVALIRSSVREVVEDAIKQLVLPHLRISASPPSPRSSELSASRSLQLRFVGTFPDVFLTLENIQDESDSLVMVELRDTSGCRVEIGPESSAKIQIVALDGDFEVDRDYWTHEEFKKHVLTARKGKKPLLVGDCEIFLKKGVAFLHNVSFTDNSKWMKGGKFRLGAWIMKGVSPGVVVRSAVSNSFSVKERRKLSYQKSKTPTLEDNIWRLESIAKNGAISRRLADEANVHTVKDFLQLHHTDAKRLEKIVRVSEKNLERMVKKAELCRLTNEHYQYYDETIGVELLLDCAFNIVSITFAGHNRLPYEYLEDALKEFAHGLRVTAYEKRSELPMINIPTNQVMLQPKLVYPSSIPCANMQFIDPTTTNQGDQLLVQVNSYSHLENTFQYEDDFNQIETCEFDQMLNTVSLQEETAYDFDASNDDKVTSKLIAACYVTKAAILFMISIQQESTAPLKKRKLH